MLTEAVGLNLRPIMSGAVKHPKLISRLRELMEERGMNMAELNRLAGISQTGVNDILDGTTRSPKLETLEKLADVFEVSVAYLIGEVDVRGEQLSLLRDFQDMDPDDKALLRQVVSAKAALKRAAG